MKSIRVSTTAALFQTLPLVVLAAGCGREDFDLVVVANLPQAMSSGSTSQIVDETKRASDAALQGSDGALPEYKAASKIIVADFVTGPASPDGALIGARAAIGDPEIEILSTVDGAVKSHFQAGNDTPIAIEDGGAHVALFTSAPFSLKIVETAGGTSVDAGTLAAPGPAAFAGTTLFAVDNGAFFRVGADGARTPVSVPDGLVVVELHGEPKGARAWGIVSGAAGASQAFSVDASSTAAAVLAGVERPLKMGVGPGGRLALLLPTIDPPQLHLTGPDGSNPQPIVAVQLTPGNTSFLVVAPGGGSAAWSTVGDQPGIGFAPAGAQANEDTFGVLTGFTPAVVAVRY